MVTLCKKGFQIVGSDAMGVQDIMCFQVRVELPLRKPNTLLFQEKS
jgi:hypothetical protein